MAGKGASNFFEGLKGARFACFWRECLELIGEMLPHIFDGVFV